MGLNSLDGSLFFFDLHRTQALPYSYLFGRMTRLLGPQKSEVFGKGHCLSFVVSSERLGFPSLHCQPSSWGGYDRIEA